MKKPFVALATLLMALAVLAPGTAHAVEDDYSDPTITIEIPGDLLYGGDDVTISASASVPCTAWTMDYLDQTVTGSGESITNTFETPVVQERRTDPVSVTCVYDEVRGLPVSGGGAVEVTPAAFSPQELALPRAVVSRSADVVLLPRGADAEEDGGSLAGLLPDTGGTTLWLLVAGAALLAAGALLALRRRH